MDKLNDLLKEIIFNSKSKTLIITSVDYEYCLINNKTEVNAYYLLNKKIEKIESKLDEMELALNFFSSNFSSLFITLFKADFSIGILINAIIKSLIS